ncbi:MAG: tRNA adenosine(34) deaminase TadA [Firmicutes bacterium]|nr:tRNA adenosine(34) deaminase TadA [Bacillota bacterium]
MGSADEFFMNYAVMEADAAAEQDEVPVGAVVVYGGEIIASAHNEKERRLTATAHAEILALERAAAALGNWYLEGCTLYVTLEPCAMCAGAAINARIDRLVYGASDPRFGCCGSIMDLLSDKRFNHNPSVTAGVSAQKCAALLSAYFTEKRKKKSTDGG